MSQSVVIEGRFFVLLMSLQSGRRKGFDLYIKHHKLRTWVRIRACSPRLKATEMDHH